MPRTALVTGATGYVGGRLVPELLDAGFAVRCFARTPAKLTNREWFDRVEVVEGDVFDPASLRRALDGVEAAYYLVHSMDGRGDFEEQDAAAARAFREAAAVCGVRRIVYVGGLGRGDDLSTHLRSRQEVGRLLAAGPVPVTELRAAMVIGSGSASFEMLRHLVEVLPAMVTPRWVETRCQPIAIRDVLHYLVAVLDTPETAGRVLEMGGPDVLTYREMLREYAEEAGLPRRLIQPVPVLSPKLSSLWIGLVTPLPKGLAKPLVESLTSEVTVADDTLQRLVPRECLPFRTALRLALRRVQDLEVVSSWAYADRPPDGSRRYRDHRAEPHPDDPAWSGGTLLVDERLVASDASPEQLFEEVSRLGGERGYHGAELLWNARGLLDVAAGGVGMRRGRLHPQALSVGDPVDFWRVEAHEPPRLLRMRAEMRLPGEAWLEFTIRPADGGGSVLRQRARFHPHGLSGRAYWYTLLPFHAFVFPRMAAGIARAAAERSELAVAS